MPATLTVACNPRSIHTRRSRMQRGAHGSATAEGIRSNGDSEDRSEVTAGSMSNNRFAVLCPKEPAPGTQEKQEPTLPQSSSVRRERPVIPPIRTHKPPADRPSSSGKLKDKSLAPTSHAITFTKRPTTPKLTPHTPRKWTRIESNRQPRGPAVASMPPTKPQASPSPLALQAEAKTARPSRPPSASAPLQPDIDTAVDYPSLLALKPRPTLPSPPSPSDPMSEPCLATLPIAPIPQDPMSEPSLAALPLHPALDFRSISSAKPSQRKSRHFPPPIPIRSESFDSDDPIRHIVRTPSGKIFIVAAEIAAANQKGMMSPVGKIMIPEPASKFGEVKGKIDRRKLDHKSEEYVDSPEEMKYGSEGDEGEGEGEGWLGKDEGFWKQPFEKERVVRSRRRRRKD